MTRFVLLACRPLTLILALVCAPVCMLSPAFSAEIVRAGGTGSGTVLLQKLAELYRQNKPASEIRIITPPLGSSGGFRALAAGQIDVVISGRPPKAEEGQFKIVEYARTPFIFASGDAKQAKGFSLSEIIEIYAGTTKTWGDGRQIRLVLRSPFESDTQTMTSISPAMRNAVGSALARRAGPVGEDDLDTVDLIGKLPGSLGPTTLGLLRLLDRRLTAMPVDGITPSLETLADGRYPYAKSLFLVTRLQNDAATTDFLHFLQSSAAHNFLRRTDHLPGFH